MSLCLVTLKRLGVGRLEVLAPGRLDLDDTGILRSEADIGVVAVGLAIVSRRHLWRVHCCRDEIFGRGQFDGWWES